jgi:hypothetical protein
MSTILLFASNLFNCLLFLHFSIVFLFYLFIFISFYFTCHPSLGLWTTTTVVKKQTHSYFKDLFLYSLCLLYSSPNIPVTHASSLLTCDIQASFISFIYCSFYSASFFNIALFITWHYIYTCLFVFFLPKLGYKLQRTELYLVRVVSPALRI